jgi:hypothetical protein
MVSALRHAPVPNDRFLPPVNDRSRPIPIRRRWRRRPFDRVTVLSFHGNMLPDVDNLEQDNSPLWGNRILAQAR